MSAHSHGRRQPVFVRRTVAASSAGEAWRAHVAVTGRAQLWLNNAPVGNASGASAAYWNAELDLPLLAGVNVLAVRLDGSALDLEITYTLAAGAAPLPTIAATPARNATTGLASTPAAATPAMSTASARAAAVTTTPLAAVDDAPAAASNAELYLYIIIGVGAFCCCLFLIFCVCVLRAGGGRTSEGDKSEQEPLQHPTERVRAARLRTSRCLTHRAEAHVGRSLCRQLL